MERGQDDDAMVIIAALVSRVEALVLASMLEAGGIIVAVGGAAHASVAVNSLALGGHRFWVPASQHHAASELIREVLGGQDWTFSYGARRAVLVAAALWTSVYAASAALAWAFGSLPFAAIFLSPLGVLGLPVNPQGRGDYYLTTAADLAASSCAAINSHSLFMAFIGRTITLKSFIIPASSNSIRSIPLT